MSIVGHPAPQLAHAFCFEVTASKVFRAFGERMEVRQTRLAALTKALKAVSDAENKVGGWKVWWEGVVAWDFVAWACLSYCRFQEGKGRVLDDVVMEADRWGAGATAQSECVAPAAAMS